MSPKHLEQWVFARDFGKTRPVFFRKFNFRGRARPISGKLIDSHFSTNALFWMSFPEIGLFHAPKLENKRLDEFSIKRSSSCPVNLPIRVMNTGCRCWEKLNSRMSRNWYMSEISKTHQSNNEIPKILIVKYEKENFPWHSRRSFFSVWVSYLRYFLLNLSQLDSLKTIPDETLMNNISNDILSKSIKMFFVQFV